MGKVDRCDGIRHAGVLGLWLKAQVHLVRFWLRLPNVIDRNLSAIRRRTCRCRIVGQRRGSEYLREFGHLSLLKGADLSVCLRVLQGPQIARDLICCQSYAIYTTLVR